MKIRITIECTEDKKDDDEYKSLTDYETFVVAWDIVRLLNRKYAEFEVYHNEKTFKYEICCQEKGDKNEK